MSTSRVIHTIVKQLDLLFNALPKREREEGMDCHKPCMGDNMLIRHDNT